MTHSPLTNEIRLSSQYSSRNGVKRDMVLWHHTASVSGHGDGVVAMMVNKTRQVSSNYVIGSDGYVWCVVDEDFRAWTSGSTTDGGKGAAFDRRSNTLECVNSTGAPTWLQSEAFYNIAAKLAVDFYQRYGIPLDRDHHVGHRELYTRWGASYATACPGGMDIDRILAMARSLLDPAAVEREKAAVRAVGTYLNKLSTEGLGAEFGKPGLQTAAAQDGIPIDAGETYSRYYHLVQMWGRKYRPDLYPAANSIDGIPGPATRAVEAVIRGLVAAGTAPGQTPPAPVVITEGSTVSLTSAIPVYPSSTKAKKGEGSTATYQPGSYTVYKVYGQAVNITKTADKAGGWVMADTLKVLTNEWLVVFNDPESGVASAVEVPAGQPVAKPADPIREDSEFQGWFDVEDWLDPEAEPFDFTKPITADVELWPAWKEIVRYTVTFDDGHGTTLSTQVKQGDRVPTPGNPVPGLGEKFLGWFQGDALFDFASAVESDLTIVARYETVTVEPTDPTGPTDPVEPTDPQEPPAGGSKVPWAGIVAGGLLAIIAAVLATIFGWPQ